MKKFYLFMLVLSLTVYSCKPDEEQKITSLILEQTQVAVQAEGGTFSILYKVENPCAEDVGVYCECVEEWLGPFDTSVDGKIVFPVTSNSEDISREAVVNVIYGDITEQFTVVQNGMRQTVPDEDLELSITDVGMVDVSWTVTPADNSMPYISMTVDKRVYDQLGSDEAYLEEDFQIFSLLAGSSGMTMEEYLSQLVRYGETPFYKDGLLPGYSYYVYAYGISLDGTALTGLYKQEIVMETPAYVDIEFDITCTPEMDKATVYVSSSIPEQMYVVDVYAEDEILSSLTLEEQYGRKLNDKISETMSDGMTRQDAVRSLAETGSGPVSFEGLYAGTDYVAFAIAVNEDGLFVSEASTCDFRTESAFSDNVIEVEITDIQSDRVSYSITTSNDDPYVMYCIQASMWEDWSDEDIIRNLIDYYDVEKYNLYRGAQQGELTGLMTKTRYVMYTFGCVSGMATTPLGKTFFTPEAGSSDITFTLNFDKYFNGDDLIAAYPEEESYKQYAGKAVLPVKAEVSDPSATYLYYVYSVDYSEYGDDVLYSSLLNGTGLSEPSYVFTRNFGRTCTVAGFAMDKNGNNGPLFRTEIEFTLEGASPISEFTPDMLEH